jgi:hypothetical protein
VARPWTGTASGDLRTAGDGEHSVPVTELFTILVDAHDLAVMDAVRGLAVGLAVAGYDEDTDAVTPTDALGIVESILSRH